MYVFLLPILLWLHIVRCILTLHSQFSLQDILPASRGQISGDQVRIWLRIKQGALIFCYGLNTNQGRGKPSPYPTTKRASCMKRIGYGLGLPLPWLYCCMKRIGYGLGLPLPWLYCYVGP